MANEFVARNGIIAKADSSITGTLAVSGNISSGGNTVATQTWVTTTALSGYATETYVADTLSDLIGAAPGTLDTLNELAAALGNDPNFATTVTNSIATKLPLAGGNMTGNINWTSTDKGLVWTMNTDGAYIKFFNTGDGDTNSRLEYGTSDNGNEYHRWMVSSVEEMNLKADGLRVTNSIWSAGNLVATQAWVGTQGFLTEEADPLFLASAAYNIDQASIDKWNTAFGWGDHSGLYAAASHTHSATDITSGTLSADRLSGTYAINISGNAATATSATDSTKLPLAGGTMTGVIDNGTSNTTGYRFGGRSFSWNSAMQTPASNVPHIMQSTYGGWDPVIGIKTSSGFWQMGAYSGDEIHFGYMAGAFGSHSTNSFDSSYSVTPSTFKIGNLGTMHLTVSGNITATGTLTASGYNKANWDTAYGWGNHASAGYGSAGDTAKGVEAFGWGNHAGLYAAASHTHAYLPLSGGTLTGQVIFPSAATTKPVLPNGFISRNDLDDTSGRHDIWGISERYYPSNPTAGDAWGIQWSGTPNDIVFVGAGTDRVSISLDEGNITTLGTVTASGGNSGNWNTAYSWGNHATAGYITDGNTNWNNTYGFITASDSITGTSAGVVRTVSGTSSAELVRGNMGDNDQARILVGATASNAGYLEIATADDGTEPIYVRQYTGVFSSLTRTATLLDGSGNTSFPGTVTASFSGSLSGNASTASKWSSARTITLGGDLTGNVSIDGSANVTLTAAVVDDSHTHDGRYYTESESDARFVNVTGDTVTGNLAVSGASLSVTSTAAGSEAFYVDGVNGRLFTISDDLSDSLFSVNTISGLPVIEAFADNTVKIGPFSNPVTVDSSGVLAIGGVTAATQTYVDNAISGLIGGAPGALDTLNELAAAINDDASYASTITTALGTKAPLASPALTGTPTAPTAATATNSTQIATTAFVKSQGYLTSLPAHTHPIGEIEGLQDELDGKQPAGSYLTSYTETDTLNSVLVRGNSSGTQMVLTATDVAFKAQSNGTSSTWRGRLGTFNSSTDASVFLGTYGAKQGVFGHNNALTAWDDLWLNTLGTSGQGNVYLSWNTYVKGSSSDTNYTLWHSGNDGAGSGLDADLLDGSSWESANKTVRWSGSGHHGNPRSMAIGYSGGNYGQFGYGLEFTGTSGVHNYAINDVVTRVDMYGGLVVYGAAGGTVGTNINWTETFRARYTDSAPTFKGNTIWHAGNDGAGSGLDADTVDGLHASSFASSSHNHDSRYMRADTDANTAGAIRINGSYSYGTYTAASNYKTGADNLVLKGNASGVSGIFFESEKDGTNINHPSDFGFIQYSAYGTGTSGESNELIIGVSNDGDDHLVFNAPDNNGLKFRVGASTTDNTVYHSGNLTLATLGYTGATNANYITNNNQLTNGAGYITSFDITTQTDPKYLRSNAADTAGGLITFAAGIDMANTNISGVNHISINDAGWGEGIQWDSWLICESPDDLTNAAGNLQFANTADNGVRVTLNTDGAFYPGKDRLQDFGQPDARWRVVFCETLDSAGLHESNLASDTTGYHATGTVLVWKDGEAVPCSKEADHMKIGIAVYGNSSPLVQGAEPVLVSGEVSEGDYLITSEIVGHAKAVSRGYVIENQLLDCVIGKALETASGESHLVKTWVTI